MENILVTIFIVLFSFILINYIYVKSVRSRSIEGMEQDDTELDMKKRFKTLEDKVNKVQEQLAGAEKSNEENAQNLKQLKNI